MNLSSSQQRTLLSVATFAAAVMLVNVVAEFAIQVWPLKFGELNWRVGAAGLLLDAFVKTIPAQVVLYFAAAVTDSRKLLRTYAILGVVLGAVAIGVLAFFALDAIQLRATLPQNVKQQFLKVALRAALVGVLGAILFFLAGVRTLKVLKSGGAVRTSGSGPRAAEQADESMLMIARPATPARPSLTAVKGDEPVKVVEA